MEYGQALFRDIVIGLNLLTWAWIILVLWLALRGRKTLQSRLIALGIAIAVLIAFPGIPIYRATVEAARGKAERAAAKARFDAYCQNAGVSIFKTVPNVRGLILLTNRIAYDAHYGEYDPYGGAMDGDNMNAYLGEFIGLKDVKDASQAYRMRFDYMEAFDNYAEVWTGFQDEKYFVIASKPLQKDGKVYRYTYKNNHIDITPSPQPLRYGIRYEAFPDMEEDHRWGIWGSKLEIVDTQTGEVLARRIGYIYDDCFGKCNDGGGKYSPTDYACPKYNLRRFSDKSHYDLNSAQGIAFQVFLREESIP